MFIYPKTYDVIVVGAGHAGVEACLASARIGCQTLLLTTNLDTIGQMSCNPAIGGLAKGHLVREIDALGGEMGINTDLTGLQFRMLNTRKGPAVRAPRAQCDKKAYQLRLKNICELQTCLDIYQTDTCSILHKDSKVFGVSSSLGTEFHSKAVVVTTGTFLRGLIHVGQSTQSGGRFGDQANSGISESLKSLGLDLGRLKTGTPPRILRRSVDFSKMTVQDGDSPAPRFSFWNPSLFHVEQKTRTSVLEQLGHQIHCHITATTLETERLIRDNISLCPLYSGKIEGLGPRYCPSIEDKIFKFPDKRSHQIFIEPEGAWTDELYVNGFSTSFPLELQLPLIRSVVGCEKATIIRPAYAVEYDYVLPTQLKPSLETDVCSGLFLAGQINGTSGYEEAGAQGIIAGINAARFALEKPSIVLGRDQAYIGVLIDDLVSYGTSEPYRMFTSRAEYRLLLRQDNADFRLSKLGFDVGLLSANKYRAFEQRLSCFNEEMARLASTYHNGTPLDSLLRRPEVSYATLPKKNTALSEDVSNLVETEIKYAGYVERQRVEVERLASTEDKAFPAGFDFLSVSGLRTEARMKLTTLKPKTVGQARRISGVTPADISLLLVFLKRTSTSHT